MIRNVSKVLIFILSVLILLIFPTNARIEAASVEYKFDFGAGYVEPGYIGVSASTAYNRARGYGFNTPENMRNVTASGTGVASDAVQFLTYGIKSNNTFNVDLPNGLYEIKVTLGNTSRASVAAECVLQIINMTGNGAVDKFQIPITDGQLNILVTAGKEGTPFTLSALEIKKISDSPVTNRTIWIGGDSTACNYYPLDTSEQCGWGQLLPKFVDTSLFQIRNMAASGQCARGFRDDGQFEAIMKYIKPGDIFLLEFGINDTNPKNDTTEEQFKEIMTDMVVKVKSTGATMVLVTPQGRATDFNGNVHTAVNRWYRNTTIQVAREQNVRLCDLNVLSSAYFTSIGQDATLALYMPGDTLHPNRAGATELARLVANDLKDLFTLTPTATAQPTISPTPTGTVPQIMGDIDGDGSVTSIDFALLKKYLLSGIPDLSNVWYADVNSDGNVNSIDYAFIKAYLLGMIKEFPGSAQSPDNNLYTEIYEAENAFIYHGIFENIHTGYSGSGYVNYDNKVGSYVEWKVNVPVTGWYNIVFKYSNGTTVNRPMSIAVNGNIVQSSMDFYPTTDWDTWNKSNIYLQLNQGQNTIRATGITSNGGPNVDYIEISKTTGGATPIPNVTPYPTSTRMPTIYLAGDSTVQSYNSSYYPQAGWGQVIYEYFTSDVKFVNKAIAGRSSKNFVEQGRLDEILNVIQEGDYLFIQFGHNDATISNPDRYAAPYTTYKEYLAKFVDGARAKGAIPVLITPVARLNYKNNTYVNDFPDYCNAMKQVAAEKNCAIIDLMTKCLNYYSTLDYNKVFTFYMVSSNGTDYTHFTETGAREIAKLVAQGVKELNLPISKYVK